LALARVGLRSLSSCSWRRGTGAPVSRMAMMSASESGAGSALSSLSFSAGLIHLRHAVSD
jgi:hypothetical protein